MVQLRVVRKSCLVAVLVAALGSVGMTFYAGHHNPSLLLRFLFALWVISPFVALLWATVVSKGWPVLAQAMLYGVTPALALGSLATYADVVWGPPKAKIGFVFVVVPLASWVVMAISGSLAALLLRKR